MKCVQGSNECSDHDIDVRAVIGVQNKLCRLILEVQDVLNIAKEIGRKGGSLQGLYREYHQCAYQENVISLNSLLMPLISLNMLN
jgi:hypothetical protein